MLTYDNARPGAVARARALRRNATDAERKLWRGLRSKLPQFKWRRQLPVGPYFADLACFAEKLIIELDGGQHATAAEYDDRRTACLEAQGYRVLRFWNNAVLENIEGVLHAISLSLRVPTKVLLSWGPARGKQPSEGRRKGEADHSATPVTTSPSQACGLGPSLSHGRGQANGAD